jgi:hypothetical protein
MKRPSKKQLVWVTWRDAQGDSSRTHVDDLAVITLATNVNLGWIIHENDRRIVLAHGYSSSGEIDHFAIPTGDIVSTEPAGYTPRKRNPTTEE